jgi:putative ABC transport system substrate-binding protein
MKRREFIGVVGGAAVWPLAVRAQQPERMRRIGLLMSLEESDLEGQRYIKAFLQRLEELGWAHGHNVQIEYRWAGASPDRIRSHAAELVGQKPDVILAQTALVLVPLQRETRTIPIVFTQVNDPVESGFVGSLTRPDGNVTGFTPLESSVAGKWLEMLREIAPGVTRAAVILNPVQAPNVRLLRAVEAAAPALRAHVTAAGVHDGAEIESAIEAFAGESNGGLIVVPNPVTITQRERIIGLAARHRLPAIYPYKYFVASGGLMSYGVDIADLFRRAASYFDRILKGAKVADLPVQNPTKFELVINLKTAKALGLEVPGTLLARADEVIE